MRQALPLVTLTMSCTIIATAEERPLQPIDRPVISGEKRCLPFFATTTFGGATAEQIIFAYQASGGNMKGDTIPKTRTLVRLTTEQTPTYENIAVDGQSGALFRLNQAEYEKARDCLPAPKPEPKAAQ
jgi:hypothetical protein